MNESTSIPKSLPQIQLENVTVEYGSTPVLDQLSYGFDAQKTYAIIGPSGCGKTTLLYAIAGLLSPQNGQILVKGETLSALRQETAIVLQEFGLFPWKTVWHNLSLGLVLKKNFSLEKRVQLETLAQLLGLTDHLHKYPAQLSGGQKQRVAIGRSWALDPDLLLMDEPFSALDALTREELQDTVVNLFKTKPTTMILVTHSIEEAVYLGQEILLMAPSGGKILKTYANAGFGLENHREQDAFFRLCQEIRQDLRGARHE